MEKPPCFNWQINYELTFSNSYATMLHTQMEMISMMLPTDELVFFNLQILWPHAFVMHDLHSDLPT